jgi:hypothetical protein
MAMLAFHFLLKVFENRVLRKIVGPKRKEITGDWRKSHYEKIRKFYSSPVITI